MFRYLSFLLLVALTACATKHEYGQADLLKWDQAKLDQQFVIGAARLADVEEVFGVCPSKRFNGENLEEGHSDLKEGRNMSCTYRHLKGSVPDCDGTSCTTETGMNEYQETNAEFTFDGGGWLQNIKYERRQHKLN